MEIKRDYYLNELKYRENNGLIKIIIGLKQSGKTYLLFNIFYNYLLDKGIEKSHIIDIALDDREYKDLRNPDNMLKYIKDKIIDDKIYYILIDEVQMMDGFEDVLNSLMHIKNADIYVTGSNSKFLSTDVITEFRGRGDEIHVYPLSFKEYTSAYDGTIYQAWDDYFNYGGMPFILSLNTKKRKEDYLKSLFEKVYISDILERHKKIKNIDELNELLDVLSSSIGSLSNPIKLSNTFKSKKNKVLSDKTISKYIGYFQDSFLISKAQRYDIKGKNYINSPYKYYFEDIGLRNARLNFRQTEENHIMENIIYNELKVRGYNVDIGVVENIEQNKKGKTIRKKFEVDFIATAGDNKYYIQSALDINSKEKELQEKKSLININDSFKKIIIVKDDVKPRKDDNGITIVGIYNFLLDESCINY